MKRIWILAVALTLAVPTFFAATRAQAVTLIPPSLEFGVKPGETLTTKVKLFNESSSPIILSTSTDVFTAGDEAGTPKFSNTPTEDIAGWIKTSSDPIVLDAGQRVDVPVEILVPANADPGGHFGVLFFGTTPNAAPGLSAVAIGSKVGALIILRVDGNIREAGNITDFSVTKAGVYSRLPVSFNTLFHNVGNVHVRPTGEVTVRNVLGGTSVVLSVNEALGAVLPSSERRFTTTWEKEPNRATAGNFFQEVGTEWNNFAFGPYTAAVNLKFGLSNDNVATQTVRFVVIPWHLLLVILLAILLIVLLTVWGVRRYNRWIISKAQKKE